MTKFLLPLSKSFDELKHPGDFRFFPDPDLTDKLLDNFLARQMNKDLIQIVSLRRGPPCEFLVIS